MVELPYNNKILIIFGRSYTSGFKKNKKNTDLNSLFVNPAKAVIGDKAPNNLVGDGPRFAPIFDQ